MPCRNGHSSERNKFGACRECLREADKRWRIRHPERHALRAREWGKNNIERRRENERNRRAKNRNKVNQKLREWRTKNPAKVRLHLKKYYENNKALFAEFAKKWAKDNPEKLRAMNRRRQAARRAAMPKWADKTELRAIYDNCPDSYEVDHIIPIKGKNICGLHVPWNLQYLTPKENKQKGTSVPFFLGA